MGYSHHLQRGQTRIYHDAAGRRACAEITGKGCTQLADDVGLGSVADWQRFMARLVEAGATFARVDFALDDHAGVLDVGQIVSATEEHRYVGRCRTFHVHEQRRIRDCQTTGAGIAFGNRKSKTFIRIYERPPNSNGQGSESAPVVRVELEVKDDQADALVRAFVAEGAAALRRDLRARVEFKERPAGRSDTNRSRWPTCEWWAAFLGDCDKARVQAPHREHHLHQMAECLERQYGRWLARLMDDPAYGPAWLDGVIERGRMRDGQRP